MGSEGGILVLKIFVSCGEPDQHVAAILARLLEKVFPNTEAIIADHRSPSDRLQRSLEQLRSCRVVVPLITADEPGSPWTLLEAGAGMASGTVLPLVVGDLPPEEIPEPLRELPLRQFDEEGLPRFLEAVAEAGGVDLPPRKVGVQEALYRLRARFVPQGPERLDITPTRGVVARVKRMIERTHEALVTLIINAMSPASVPAEQDLHGMRLHQLRDLADYAHVQYPAFLLFTLSSLEMSGIERDEASWSLFEQGQLDRLEKHLKQLERDAKSFSS
jgi:hypothetical protein